jgi:outer membrane receptor protein involved in Fe transport
MKNRKISRLVPRALLGAALVAVSAVSTATAQSAASPKPGSVADPEEEVLVLTPFVVDASKDEGYSATETLSGTRLRTNLADVGSSISVLTAAFMRDVNATNSESVLAYVTNAEIGGARGTFSGGMGEILNETNEADLFSNPNANTRIRGLTSADNTRNYFIADIPWDGYTVSRVDLLRGPNAILFGLGSPAGIINVTTNAAQTRNRGSLGYQFDKHGSQRFTFDYNRTMFDKQLAVRGSLLRNEQKFQQKPAYSDDERYYGAILFRPKFLNRPGYTFEITGNYEHGSIKSNRPRTTPPADQLSGWWRPAEQAGLNKKVFNPIVDRAILTRGSPIFDPAVGTYRSNNMFIYDAQTGVLRTYQPLNNYGALRPDGTTITAPDGTNTGPFPQFANYQGNFTPASWATWASKMRLPFRDIGAYKRELLLDPSIFDYYHTLTDGPTKAEWTDWNVHDVSLSQTFLDQQLGYNASVFQQRLDRGQYAAMGWSNLILLDVETHLVNGQENPNVGRPYMAEEFAGGSSNTGKTDRDARRFQAFAAHDFSKGDKGFLRRLLGEQRLTATVSEEKLKTDRREQHAWGLDPVTRKKLTGTDRIVGDNTFLLGMRHYLGGTLKDRSSPIGANIPGMTSDFFPGQGGPINILYFDNTWTAGSGVSPGAPWTPPDPMAIDGPRVTQSANPANYKGWTNYKADLITINSNHTVNGMSARDYLTETAQLKQFDVKSQSFAWQGYLWDKSIIGTYGWRKDKSYSYDYQSSLKNRNARPDGGANVNPASYNFDNPTGFRANIESTSKNYSVALHVNRLLAGRDFLPVNLSLYYNKATNFQPLAGRRDINSVSIAPPEGATEEYSALVSTKDGKYSMRVTKYETAVTLASSTAKVNNLWALEQNLASLGKYASPAGILRGFRSGEFPLSDYSYNAADQAKLVNSIMPAWFAFEKELKAKFPAYVEGWMGANTVWGTDSNNTSSDVLKSKAPAGFSYTEDNQSKGWEVEFTANPTQNWRLGANASRTEVRRDNVPGKGFLEVAAFIEDKIMNTDAGLAPVWWTGNTFGLRSVGPWNQYYGDYLNIITLNGRSNPEVRKWRANLFTNYDFTEGRLKGAGVGGGYRWQDKSVIGYAPKLLANGKETSTNLAAPVYAPSNNTFDLWLSYKRKLTDKVGWRIQLNVNNVFGKNELVPISAGVDPFKIGSVGTITATSVIPMINTSYYIREGRSWNISSTFEF